MQIFIISWSSSLFFLLIFFTIFNALGTKYKTRLVFYIMKRTRALGLPPHFFSFFLSLYFFPFHFITRNFSQVWFPPLQFPPFVPVSRRPLMSMSAENMFPCIPAIPYPVYVTTYQITSVIEKQYFILRYKVDSRSLQAIPGILAFLQDSTA